MNKERINKSIYARCLLTDVAPYETPTLFSFWGGYNYVQNIDKTDVPPLLASLFFASHSEESIPFKYRIKKGTDSTRILTLIHPKHSQKITDFYKDFDLYITKLNRRSPFSLRAATEIAKNYRITDAESDELKEIEDSEADRVYASSYFKYHKFSHFYHFFDSDEYADLEKNYEKFFHADISRCFDSIYTHTISWAVKGKAMAKKQKGNRDTFDGAFDNLLQSVNYRETNGIPIGPELSRLFAEIILQRIDLNVLARMTENKIRNGFEYCCYRYVDDIFFFFNDEKHQKIFVNLLTEELEIYRLYLNNEKQSIRERPFITKESLSKLSISEFITEFWERLPKMRLSQSSKEIAKLRARFQFNDIGFNTVSSLFFGSLKKRIKKLDLSKYSNRCDILYVISDITFHAFRMDSSASSSYKVTELILAILDRAKELTESEQARLTDKIIYELRGAIISTVERGYNVEAINTLIALREIKVESAISVEFITNLLARCRTSHRDENSGGERLNYFCIVALIYVMENRPEFNHLREEIARAAVELIEKYSPKEYAESSFLLLDLTACPFLTPAMKNAIILPAIRKHKPSATNADIAVFREFVLKHVWFFNWNKDDKLKTLLRKKSHQPTY